MEDILRGEGEYREFEEVENELIFEHGVLKVIPKKRMNEYIEKKNQGCIVNTKTTLYSGTKKIQEYSERVAL